MYNRPYLDKVAITPHNITVDREIFTRIIINMKISRFTVLTFAGCKM